MKVRGGAGGYPDHVALSFAELRKGDEVLGRTVIGVDAAEGGYKFEVDAPWISGGGIWPDAVGRDAFIKLDRLFFPKSESTDTATALDPRDFPSIELEIADFRVGRRAAFRPAASCRVIGRRVANRQFRFSGRSRVSIVAWQLVATGWASRYAA